jgi:hypothetical protein
VKFCCCLEKTVRGELRRAQRISIEKIECHNAYLEALVVIEEGEFRLISGSIKHLATGYPMGFE